MDALESLILKLDLGEFVAGFRAYFARQKSIKIEGDISKIKHYIDELDSLEFSPPREVTPLDTQLIHLSKLGVLRLSEIYEWSKIIAYFGYLKALKLDNVPNLGAWLNAIEIPPQIAQIAEIFDDKGALRSGFYEEFDSLNLAIKAQNKESKSHIVRLFAKSKLESYLVDKQTHFVDSKECLLLRAGFENALDGRIVARTQAGFFLVCPKSLQHIYERIEHLQNKLEIAIYRIEEEISKQCAKHILFLKFINRAFDTFDAWQARVRFAKDNNYEFIVPSKKNGIVLRDFCHPALTSPIPVSVDFTRQILIITGVNAGGKTMLLKSILSAAILAKCLLPFKINAAKSRISHFKSIWAIINDPQNSKNDISTFAGRMLEFGRLLGKDEYLLGIDEIELGTDSNEASALFYAILEHLKRKNVRVVVTTHHKQLASMFAANDGVELIAALYDEANRTPTFGFLAGTIGKSYAFETALRYGIAPNLVQRAREIYGENLENLSDLIEQTSKLKIALKDKENALDSALKSAECKNAELDSAIRAQNEALRAKIATLESVYNDALAELKSVLKSKDSRAMHRFLNKQKEMFERAPKPEPKAKHFALGSRVRSGANIGTIVKISDKIAQVELDNGKILKIPTALLESAKGAVKPREDSAKIPKNPCGVSLDLHGKRVDEALELLDIYISNCLLAGFDEVIIMHGIGSGVLSKVVRDFLSAHPKVKDFSDAPASSGGFGAKIVRF